MKPYVCHPTDQNGNNLQWTVVFENWYVDGFKTKIEAFQFMCQFVGNWPVSDSLVQTIKGE